MKIITEKLLGDATVIIEGEHYSDGSVEIHDIKHGNESIWEMVADIARLANPNDKKAFDRVYDSLCMEISEDLSDDFSDLSYIFKERGE